MSNIYAALKDQITTADQIQILLADAARTERFISKPRHPGAPSMYDLITTSYDENDMGYYKKELKLTATSKQITRWEFAIDVLLLIKPDISKDTILDRQLFWMRANRFKWTQLARHFYIGRTTLKNRYEKVLYKLADKIRKEIKFDNLNKLLYLI